MHTELKLSTFFSKPRGRTTKSARPVNNREKIDKANSSQNLQIQGKNFKDYFL
jgi:hypothetical protein